MFQTYNKRCPALSLPGIHKKVPFKPLFSIIRLKPGGCVKTNPFIKPAVSEKILSFLSYNFKCLLHRCWIISYRSYTNSFAGWKIFR